MCSNVGGGACTRQLWAATFKFNFRGWEDERSKKNRVVVYPAVDTADRRLASFWSHASMQNRGIERP